MTNCTKCGNEVKIIPAGISKKTGKAYNAFWKCQSCGMAGYPAGSKPQRQEPKAQVSDTELKDLITAVLMEIRQLDVPRIKPFNEKPKEGEITLPF